ncbi:c-type cytochrome [Cereibacter sediminicola]|nr:c-type cytochrome [Cereibacter sediminicola]
MRRVAMVLLAGVAGFLVVTSPATWSMIHPTRDQADAGPADLENGRTIFLASDCATCHATPGQPDQTRLGGGRVLDTDFGRFHMPNISPDPVDGIGNWTLAQFTRAVREGVGPDGILPDGQNLYPSFPYTSYQRLDANDVRDMYAYIMSLEPVAGQVPEHELTFPYNIRRGIGLWRLAFLDGQPLPSADEDSADPHQALLARGRYLVEGAGHCAECHSPRSFMGNVIADSRYGGGPTPDGHGHFPNISPDETGIGFWSVNAIANYLETGISPIGKKAGGDMEEVILNTAQLSREDRLAMAMYLKSVPAVDAPGPGRPEPNRTPTVVMLERPAGQAPVLPTSPVAVLAEAADVHVVTTKPLFLDPTGVGTEGAEDGKLLGGARLEVLAREGDRMQVRLDGWQAVGAEQVVYAERGQRILLAVLGDAAMAAVSRKAPEEDPGTGQPWARASLTAWVDGQGLHADLPALWGYAGDLFNSSCATCHSLPHTDRYLANQWIGNLNAMKRFTSLNDEQYRLLLAYLQNHSRDVGPLAEAE